MFFLLVGVLVIALFVVCGRKGFRSLLSLVLSIAVLTLMVIHLIIDKYDPVLVTLLASIPITFLVIYLTEGFNKVSHLSILLTLAIFFLISILVDVSISAAGLSGIVSDESITVGGQMGIDLPQLLIASIMLSTLGALIEMIVTQVGTVTELIEADPSADEKQIYKQSYTVGIIHLGSIINTLFLIYAGVLLPTLIVFSGSQGYLFNILNYEPASSEIFRVLMGTIGLIVAMPVSTYVAAHWLKRGTEMKGTSRGIV
jgi:uncharacterized membrane protein